SHACYCGVTAKVITDHEQYTCMKNNKLFSLSFLAILMASCAGTKHAQKMVLSWEENFNQLDGFDTSRWSKIPRGKADWQKYMSDFDSCYAMRDGTLILRGIVNSALPNDTARYLTGGVYTKDKVGFGFGRLEIYAKLNGARGAWPAFWMLSQGMNWPDGGEIEIRGRWDFDYIAYHNDHSHYN